MAKRDAERPRRTDWKALDIRVIVVAIEGYDKDWAAYIGAVRGDCHEDEWEEVAKYGSKLRKEIAEVIFPQFRDLRYRR